MWTGLPESAVNHGASENPVTGFAAPSPPLPQPAPVSLARGQRCTSPCCPIRSGSGVEHAKTLNLSTLLSSNSAEGEAGRVETALKGTTTPRETARPRIDPDGFEAVVIEHQQRIFRVLLALTHDDAEADCLTQECFLRAYRKRASFRGEASLGTWLTRIAINLAHDRRKSRTLAFWNRTVRGDAERLAGVADSRRTPESALLAQELRDRVWAAVDSLPAKRRTAFVLRFAEEMSLEEIAAAMNTGVGTVKSHIWHAVRAVRRDLGRGK